LAKKEKRIDTDKLIKRIEEWLGSQKYFRYRLIYMPSIKNVVYRSLKNSKVINFSWKECFYNETKSTNNNAKSN